MKPVRILFHMFLLFIFVILFGPELTHSEKHRINLFRQFVNKKQRIVLGQEASNINYSTVGFNVCRLYNQSLLTMIKPNLWSLHKVSYIIKINTELDNQKSYVST